MAFNSIKIIGNGVAQTAITNTHIVESVVHSLLAYNTSGSTTSFSIAVDGSTVVTQSIAAGGSYTLPIKLNVPVGASMTVTAATGVDVTVNYYSQAIDAVAGVNAVQALVTEAEAHVASIPDGTINDSITTAVDTWSSSKITSELAAIPQVTVNNTLTSNSTTEALSAAQGKALQDTKLGLSGGTMTGAITALKETKVAMAANDIDLSLGNFFTKTISTATTLTLSNIPATGQAVSFVLELTNGGSSAVTWFSGVKWVAGKAPTLTASGIDTVGFITHDGGVSWLGYKMGLDMKVA